MSVDHYATLGVSRGANADEIRAAFRSKASAAHPDRGGDGDAMAAINRAYAVLSNPATRASYDAGGGDQLEKPIEDEARDMLLGAFSQVIDRDDCLAEAARMLAGVKAQIEAHVAEATAKRGRLVKRRDKVKTHGDGENLLHAIVDQHIAGLGRQLEQVARARKVQAQAVQMLAAYELDPDGEPQILRPQSIAWGGFTAFGGTGTSGSSTL